MEARLVNVILVEDGSDQTYFTLEGVQIGGFKSGTKQEPPKMPEPMKQKKGGVVGRPTPDEVKKDKERQTDRLIDEIRGDNDNK